MEADSQQLYQKLESAVTRLEEARPFAKARYQNQVLEFSRRLLGVPGGIGYIYQLAARMDHAGLFAGTDWDNPAVLLPSLVNNTLEHGEKATVTLECLSQLRLLAIANRETTHLGISSEQAQRFLTQVLALNLHRLFGSQSETQRVRLGAMAPAVSELFQYLLDHIGYEDILGNLIEEIWRILAQRPIQVSHVKAMITQIALVLSQGEGNFGEARLGADRLVSALFGPTQHSLDDPGLELFRQRLLASDQSALQREANGFARSMHDTGLVSDYHADFITWLLANDNSALIPDALGLSTTGLDVLRSYQDLVHALIRTAVTPQTGQAVYGLALLLERGILYAPPVAPSLWRHLVLPITENSRQNLRTAFGTAQSPETFLMAGVISILGLPLGIGQGNNPTCQSARAICMWAYNDPDYLLNLIAQAASTDGVLMHFEGQPLISNALPLGLALTAPLDTDPVSVVLVPPLDRIYQEMGRLCTGRAGDQHRWINPEFHGWWVGREFHIAVDVASGALTEFAEYVRQFYANYHPYYNGNQPLIHPQPAGVALTDSTGSFVGWHAITLLRVALDLENNMRVYFYNPNNDSGQNWGHGVQVSTHGFGERFGEASLPFAQLASRLYIFHTDPLVDTSQIIVEQEDIQTVTKMAQASWAQGRIPPGAVATS